MEKSDVKRFEDLMIGTGELFSNNLSPLGLELMFKALKRYSYEQINKATHEILRTRKYTKMPTVADFIEAIEGPQEKIDDDRAELQAMSVIDEIRRVGSWGAPRFDDPITADLVRRRFGWQSLCEMQTDKTSFFVREFKSAYLSYDRIEKRKVLQLETDIDPGVKKLCQNIGG